MFRDNEIDWKVLPNLTLEDLKEIGVVAIGHRRKLLDAIAALGAEAGAAAVPAPPDAPALAPAERRQLTVMFCDIMRDNEEPAAARMHSAETLLAYGHGKPRQQLEHIGKNGKDPMADADPARLALALKAIINATARPAERAGKPNADPAPELALGRFRA